MTGLTIDITGNCNLACKFCYQDLNGQELSVQKIRDIIQKNPDAKVVNIGGGEPFSHANIEEIIRSIAKTGRRAHISTNGTIIPEGILAFDDELSRNTDLQVSINAATRDTYLRVSGKDLFNAVLANVDSLRKKYFVSLSAAIYRENFAEAENIVGLGKSLDLPVRIGLVFPAGKGKDVELITPAEANRLRGFLLVEKINNPKAVYSDIINGAGCVLLGEVYGLQNNNSVCCHEKGQYHYYNQNGEKRNCEFDQNK